MTKMTWIYTQESNPSNGFNEPKLDAQAPLEQNDQANLVFLFFYFLI